MVSVNCTETREAIITQKKFKEFILYTYLFHRIFPLFILIFSIKNKDIYRKTCQIDEQYVMIEVLDTAGQEEFEVLVILI